MAQASKIETVTIEIEAEKLQRLEETARQMGTTVSSYLSDLASDAADRDRFDQPVFRVSAEAFDEIEKMLNEPAKVDPKLVELFRKRTNWID